MFSNKTLVETALNVLVAWNDRRKPIPADLAVLKAAFPSCAHLADDELACQVIHDLGSTVFAWAEHESQPQIVKQVA